MPFAAILTKEGSIFNSFLILFAESAAEIPQRRFFTPKQSITVNEHGPISENIAVFLSMHCEKGTLISDGSPKFSGVFFMRAVGTVGSFFTYFCYTLSVVIAAIWHKTTSDRKTQKIHKIVSTRY